MPVVKGFEWTFDTEAERYAEMRPGYPDCLYTDIFSYIPINKNSNVIEIGIGGGQATPPFLGTGCKLTAVEYGTNFSQLCCRKFACYPEFSVINKKFEDCEYEENSCDLIYSASAFHWIPEETGYVKVFSMLKSGGAFARFANHCYKDKGREELHRALQEVYAVYMPGSQAGDEYTEAEAARRADIALKYGFTDITYRLYRRTRTFTSDAYIRLLGTYSDHIAIEERTRARFFSEIKNVIDSFGGQITVYDTVDLQLARKP